MIPQSIEMTDPRKSDYLYEEAIKTLRTNIKFTGVDIKSIVVTSCYPNEGKSDIAFQLAREMGNAQKHVLVIDADIRKSNYVKRFQVSEKVQGLSQYLSGQVERKDIIYRTNFPGVDMVFAGPSAPNPSELLESEKFSSLVMAARERYDYVIIDTPPTLSMTDAAVVAKQSDGAILVIESNAVSYKAAMKAKSQLAMSGCRLLGAVLNKVDVQKDKYYTKYTYTYYYGNDRQ